MLRFFERLVPAFPNETPSQPPNTLWAFCRHYSRGSEPLLIIMTLLSTLVAIMEVSLFARMGQLVDILAQGQAGAPWSDEQRQFFISSLLLIVSIPLVIFLRTAVVHQGLLGNYPMAIRWLSHGYLLKQSLGFFHNDFAGRLATKVMQTSLSVRETVLKLLDVMVYVSVYFLSMLYLVAQADWRLAIPMFVWLLIYLGVQYYLVPRLKRISSRQAEARAMMTGRVVDSYTNMQTVKLFAHSQQEADYAKEGMDAFLQTVHQQMRLATHLIMSVQVLNYSLALVIAVMSVWLWSLSLISLGAIALAISLSLRLNGMAQWIMWEISALFENIGTTTDGMNSLSKPLTIVDAANAQPLKVEQGSIELQNLSFHYGKGSGLIEQLNLQIQPGEKIGLVGRSGAGKSTLVNLLLRFYEPEQGRILIDGQDINLCQQESLRAQIAMVTQDTSLLHRSIADNIAYGSADASMEDIIRAAKQAEAHEFIEQLTDQHGNQGYAALVGERGVKLSGGQRQRIAIARVLLKNAPILILDEATSALDSEVEAAINRSLSTLMQGKTVIAIAHRLSTIAALDRLIVLDQGRIVEQGTHQELLANQGLYAQLWAHQSGGFLGEE